VLLPLPARAFGGKLNFLSIFNTSAVSGRCVETRPYSGGKCFVRYFFIANTSTPTYTEIALDNYLAACALGEKAEIEAEKETEAFLFKTEQIDEQGKSSFVEQTGHVPNFVLNEMLAKIRKALITSIVFSAFSLESFIYDYGISTNIEKYMKKDVLDRLDLYAKYVVIPRLVTGRDIDVGNNAFSLLRRIIKYRNSIAHPKSRRIHDISLIDNVKEPQADLKDMAKTGLNAIYQIAVLFDDFDNDATAKAMFGIGSPLSGADRWKEFLEKH
jgi:hypothetical protein